MRTGGVFSVLWFGAATAACAPQSAHETSCAEQVSAPPAPGKHEAIGWKRLAASSGGRVDIPDGAWLDVPPGALPCDSTITVRISKTPYSGVRTYLLEPAGLQFDAPVVLNIPYSEPVPGVEPLMAAYSSSASSPVVKAGAEETNWEPVEVAYRDEDANVLGLSLPHFTFVYAFVHVDENAYLVLDLPDKFLSPGDALFSLTAADDANVESNWSPGHVGMVVRSPDEAKGRPIARLVEATPPKVREGSVNLIKGDAGHIYLGARRPPDPVFSLSERIDAAVSGVTKIGDDYSLIGQGNLDSSSWSCVGLVEHCWDTAGRGLLDEWREVTAATPLELFRATRPITEINERFAHAIDIPIYGVTLHPKSPVVMRTFRGFYQKTGKYEIFLDQKPDGASFEGSAATGYRFQWTPTREQGCVHTGGTTQDCVGGVRSHVLPFRMKAYPDGLLSPWLGSVLELTEVLTVRVTSGTAVKTVSPSGELGTAQHVIAFGIAKGAFVHSLELLDEETGLPPAETPFPGQTLTIKSKECKNDSCGVAFEIKNALSSVPTGSKKFRLTADYSLPPEYTGP